MKKRKGVLWFRTDLRLHDNESLVEAIGKCDEILPVFVYDVRWFKDTGLGFKKMGQHRLEYLNTAVKDLKKSLKARGSDLYIAVGKPEEVLFELAKLIKSSWIFCLRERTYEEVLVQNRLEEKLWGIGQEMLFFRGKMLIHTADLPFPVPHTPDVFTQFRKEVEGLVPIREPFPTPDQMPPIPAFLEVPSFDFDFTTFGYDKIYQRDERSVIPTEASESEGLKRVEHYFFTTSAVSTYKETRNGLVGQDYSTKFSIFLSLGSLSPKYVYQRLKSYEQIHGSNESTYWVYFELLWRDFFRFQAKKHGNKIFQYGGILNKKRPYIEDSELFAAWCQGRTGVPFIDANMRELNATGFMSNRGRQNTASYLIHDLKLPWLWGAKYFEHQLIDYDPCSNYGNWGYIAGIGWDPRQDRHFNVLQQAKRYDPDGAYVRRWIPELNQGHPHEKYSVGNAFLT